MEKQHLNPVPEGIYVYYVREGKRIIGSVAFQPNDDGTVNRGIAITGIGESGGRRIGRSIAINRLAIALKDEASTRPINFKRDACARFATCFEGAAIETYKCGYGEEPTAFETRITKCADEKLNG